MLGHGDEDARGIGSERTCEVRGIEERGNKDTRGILEEGKGFSVRGSEGREVLER